MRGKTNCGRQLYMKHSEAIRANFKAAQLAIQTIDEETKDLNSLPEELAQSIGKKPKVS